MLTSFYTAAMGAIAQQQKLGVGANNIANVSTDGFKPNRASFAALLYTDVHAPQTGSDLRVGQGDRLDKTDTVFTQGTLSRTGRSLDYALPQGNAFFAVRCTDGQIRYTRAGDFKMSQNEDGSFSLRDSGGGLVLDGAGNPIGVQDGEAPLNVGVYSFRNRDGLLKSYDNYFEATAISGAAQVSDAKPVQGSLEESAVDLADELTELLTAQKDFAFNAKIAGISDEAMQSINNLK